VKDARLGKLIGGSLLSRFWKRARQKDMPIDDYLKEAALEYAGAVKRLCDESRVAATISIRK